MIRAEMSPSPTEQAFAEAVAVMIWSDATLAERSSQQVHEFQSCWCFTV
ncbi:MULTISPECIES: hypothetical protein [Mesorhizobium]|nr:MULTISPECIES: hypothetical protein [Mesorhizobium]MCA0002167.1 hypothetical protein [Mesorhizobium sp. B264B2A]MCA0008868.1 hypothetical protein [Mesorhizobium sp. B264B1B]MCA0015411.1 hypothetical protein [Mesorhizobium sp. B294B1A1]MCA0020369.1 hypothetical protein [Mesorhizobium sp. B264B1A]MCA0024012.1 hypothetical protein [Mesorhizobium sp. B263B1A]